MCQNAAQLFTQNSIAEFHIIQRRGKKRQEGGREGRGHEEAEGMKGEKMAEAGGRVEGRGREGGGRKESQEICSLLPAGRS